MFTGPASDLVLVAEDDPDLRELIAMSVEGAGFRTVCAKDGNTAARIVEVAQPRLVVTDVRMPALTGLELCRLVRTNPQLRGTQVIMVSAATDPADIEAGYAAGADDYLTKPFSPRHFRARLLGLLTDAASFRTNPAPRHSNQFRYALPAHGRNHNPRWASS